MPFFGLPLSALGTVLGLLGIFVSVMRNGVGLGMPVAGTAISGLVLGLSGFFWGGIFLGVANVVRDVEQGANEQV